MNQHSFQPLLSARSITRLFSLALLALAIATPTTLNASDLDQIRKKEGRAAFNAEMKKRAEERSQASSTKSSTSSSSKKSSSSSTSSSSKKSSSGSSSSKKKSSDKEDDRDYRYYYPAVATPYYRPRSRYGFGAGYTFPIYGGSTVYRTTSPLVGPPPPYDYAPYAVYPSRGYIFEAAPTQSYRSAPPAAYGPPLHPPAPPSGVKSYWGVPLVAIQVQLARRGLYRGPIDGVFGSGTRRAVEMYQRQNGLPVTGMIDQRLLAHLGML